MNPNDFYRRDMIVTINALSVIGAGVVPKAKKYEIEIQAKGDLDLFIMNTCHQETVKRDAWNVTKEVDYGPFGWGTETIIEKNKLNFTYTPNAGIEDGSDCAMELRGMEIIKGRHSFAFIEFESALDKMQAINRCNGQSVKASGVAVCQSRQGLKQVLEFAEIVRPSRLASKCGFTGNKKIYEYELIKGKCVALFKGQVSGETFKIVTIGYEKILIRK